MKAMFWKSLVVLLHYAVLIPVPDFYRERERKLVCMHHQERTTRHTHSWWRVDDCSFSLSTGPKCSHIIEAHSLNFYRIFFKNFRSEGFNKCPVKTITYVWNLNWNISSFRKMVRSVSEHYSQKGILLAISTRKREVLFKQHKSPSPTECTVESVYLPKWIKNMFRRSSGYTFITLRMLLNFEYRS